jgi:hypothetical protein
MTQQSNRRQLLLLVASFDNHEKDLIATTLAWMCRENGVYFDVYYVPGMRQSSLSNSAARRHIHDSDQGGGLFSSHGSTLLGGRHYQAIAHALAQYETTVIRTDDVYAFNNLFQSCAKTVVDTLESVVDIVEFAAQFMGCPLPHEAVAVQTRSLPPQFEHGIVQFVYPEIAYRKALGVPLELSSEAIDRLRSLGVDKVWSIAAENAAVENWVSRGIELEKVDVLGQQDDYLALSLRVADRWKESARGVDLCEPVLASYWLPYSVRENRLHLCSERMTEACEKLAPLAKELGQRVVYGRYAGGPICRADDDRELFPLFRNNIAYQVIEPGRPVLRVITLTPGSLPQPKHNPFDLEPTDEQLKDWAAQGKILTTLVFHSGELSHDDAIINVMELASLSNVKIGIPMQLQRYRFNPDCVELLHIPTNEGGVLGLCEPVLHSSGLGILAEGLASPDSVAEMMKMARNEIANIAGERFAPRGVYCYLDARPDRWNSLPEDLWRAIKNAGFEYVISSVQPGESRILYRDEDFVVLNLQSANLYPYSPFVRVNSVTQMAELERVIARTGRPGWLIAAIDTPIFAYSNYLVRGTSRPEMDKPLMYRGATLGKFFDYIRGGGELNKLISATPHTIARYARITATD